MSYGAKENQNNNITPSSNSISSNKLELKITHKGSLLLLHAEDTDDVKKLREIIKNTFSYSKTDKFDIYCGKYLINDLFDGLAIAKLLEYFSTNKYTIIPTTEKDPFTLDKKDKTLNSLLEEHKETVDNYLSLYEIEDYMKHCWQDMNILSENMTKMYDDICREEEYLKKNGLLYLHDHLCSQIEEETNRVKTKETYLAQCFVRILELKSMEKEAVEIVRENKKLMASIYTNNIKIDNRRKEIQNISTRQHNLVKKKENEARLLENYIASKNRWTIIEYVKLRFFRVQKHNVIMKVLNEKDVIAYKPNSNEGKIEKKQMIDTCEFASFFTSQVKRDEFSLNFKEKLIISIRQNVFLFDYKSGVIEKLKDLAEDHKGGSFIYVPFTNSIYCVSGLMSVLTERLKLNKNMEITNDSDWETVNKLISPRSYYCSFVQNDCKIYIILGFDLWYNEYLTSVDKYDTSNNKEGWVSIKLKGDKTPKLSFSACIPCSDDEVYIIGGKDENHEENIIIYCYDVKNNKIEDSYMRMPLNSSEEESKNLFYQENSFIALKMDNDEFEQAFMVALFDSKNAVHLVNIKNFDYSYLTQDVNEENIIDQVDLDSDRENVEDEEMYKETEKMKTFR